MQSHDGQRISRLSQSRAAAYLMSAILLRTHFVRNDAQQSRVAQDRSRPPLKSVPPSAEHALLCFALTRASNAATAAATRC